MMKYFLSLVMQPITLDIVYTLEQSEVYKMIFQSVAITMLAAIAILGIIYAIYSVNKKQHARPVVNPTQSQIATPPANDGEIVAAIIAAITAYRSEDANIAPQNTKAFRVVSFRKK